MPNLYCRPHQNPYNFFSNWMIGNGARTEGCREEKTWPFLHAFFFRHVAHETNKMRTNLWDVKRLYNSGLEVCKGPYCIWQVCVGTVTYYKGKVRRSKVYLGRLLQPTFSVYIIKYLRFFWKELRDHFQNKKCFEVADVKK